MSLAGALNNAGSGLNAAARLADTISNNVANAMTPGYARRTTELSSLTLGGYGSGVMVAGTFRTELPQLTAERRMADAAAGAARTTSAAFDRIMSALGQPGSPGALATRATALEAALIGAAAQPQSHAKLAEAVAAARSLAGTINAAAAETQAMRTEADAEIARQVGTLNAGLARVDELNRKIEALSRGGADTSALEDERGRVIDGLAEIVPLRTVRRDGGALALYTANGAVLLDGRAFPLEFTRGPAVITPDVTVGTGLSALYQDRGGAGGPDLVPVATGRGPFDGGSLAALFELRDGTIPALDAELDRYAADLVDRFEALMPAGALDGGGFGLFVDAGPAGPVGLAARLAVNAAVDPAAGGAVWRLRAGLDAAGPGNEGFSGYLEAMADAMVAARPGGFASTGAANGAAGFAGEITAFYGNLAARTDETRAYVVSQQAVLGERESDMTGVDTDAQLQFLMLVEQAYAANARVLTVVDNLLKQLLEI